MARRISQQEATQSAQERAAAAAEAEAAGQAAAELAMLHPDLSLRLRGRLLTLREYRGIEGLHLQSSIRPLLDDLYALFAKDGPAPTALQVREVLARHSTTVQWLIAQSATPYPADPNGLQAFTEATAEAACFVGELDDIELDALLAVWWAATGPFFIRRFREKRQAESQSASSASTPA